MPEYNNPLLPKDSLNLIISKERKIVSDFKDALPMSQDLAEYNEE